MDFITAPISRRLPAPRQIHVWSASLEPDCSPVRDWDRLLSPDELHRAARFAFPLHRARFVRARGMLRLLLGDYLDVAPQKVEFSYGVHGKPSLADNELQFNVSHSQNRVLFAFNSTAPVGVDLERLRKMDGAAQIASNCFSDTEMQRLGSYSADQHTVAFFKCWTRKEAFVKALGSGLFYPLRRFTVSCDEPARLLHVDGNAEEAGQWTIHHMVPEQGFVAAIAVRQVQIEALTFQFPESLYKHV